MTPRFLRRFAALRAGPLALALLAAAAAGPVNPASAHSLNASGSRAYVPHEVIVGYTPRAHLRAMAAAERRLGLRRRADGPAPRSRLLRVPRGETVRQAIRRLRRQPGIAYAEPDYIAHAAGAGAFYPNDGGRGTAAQGWERLQWNLMPDSGVDAPWAWSNLLTDHRPGGRGVTVAVLDTGVAYRDWKQYVRSPDFGGTHFVSPYDFIDHNTYPLDRNGHGTFVAGVVAESTNNKVDLTGLAYGVSIMPVRVLDGQGEGDEATIARGIRYAVAHHASVINLSLEFLPTQVNSGSQIPQIVNAIAYAHRKGVIVVGAAGNDETNEIAYPARVPGVVSVGATTRDRCLADYSNGGSGLDLVAPGGGDDAIISGDPDCHPDRTLPSIYQLTFEPPRWGHFILPGYYIGTSMASPEVAATAGLIIASRVLGAHPSPDAVLARLEETATPLGGPRPNTLYGYGLLNAGAATANQFQQPLPTTTS